MQAELRKAPSSGAKRSSGTEPASAAHQDDAVQTAGFAADLEGQLGDLEKILSEHAGSVEDFVRKHPLVSVLTAFALGVAVGRMTRRA